MSRKKISWTEQQLLAIKQRGRDVLVTASAGTGKTAVLSGRCVDIVSDSEKCPSVWNILVLTFTEMAAEQMRERIGEQLRAKVLEDKGNEHLRRQSILLGGADISTIHSFCKRLITEHFYELGLDPRFRVIDEDEQRLLKSEVLEETLEWAWGQSNIAAGMESLLRGRDLRLDGGFISNIIGLSEFLDGVVSRENWYERAEVLAELINPYEGKLGEKQKQVIARELQQIMGQLRWSKRLYERKGGGEWAVKCEEEFTGPVKQCLEYLTCGDWAKFSEALRGYKKPRVYKPKGVEESVGEIIRVSVKDAVDRFAGLSELALVNPDYMDKVGGACSGQTKIIIELVRKFERFYSEAKLKANCLDFADLERYALRLLTSEGENGGLVATETAVGLRERYKYIFVDEYQDINAVQQAILDSLSGEDNVFVVGDVKQSIYGFRGTDPGIFARQLKVASSDVGEAKSGLRVDLNLSFRSRKGILDFVNRVFGRIMRSSVASIDYDESAELKRGLEAESEGKGEPVVELVIVDSEEKGVVGERGYSVRECEAASVARRIREMVGADGSGSEFKIFDKELGEERAVDYRDIVILMRSPSKRVNDYIRILRLAGVPISCSVSGGYFESTEIRDCLSLLKVLDNPRRDIELAAVLRSPFFGVNDSELAKIKIAGGGAKNFYDCVVEYSKTGKEAKLSEKLCVVLGQLEKWRDVGRSGEIADLIWQVYRKTGYLSYVTAMANGQQRRANLLKLHERAIQFEGFVSGGGQPSLRRFIEFLEKLEEAGQDWSGAEPEASVGNAVRIMSIHRSKGLEFPVVFLAELNSPFSSKDFASDCIADASYAVGLRVIDRTTNTKLDSIAYQLIEREKREKFLAEEMRILYVGMTRARERLVLSGCARGEFCHEVISKGYFAGDGPIADWEVRGCKSGLEWVLLGLSCERELHEGFGTDLAVEGGGLFRLGYYKGTELVELCDYLDGFKSKVTKGRMKVPKKGKAVPERFLCLKESLGWRYGYSSCMGLLAKDSVTGITHRNDKFAKFDYTAALERRPKVVLGEEAESVEGRLVGTATHLLISELDLSKAIDMETAEQVRERLLREGVITEAAAESIDVDSVVGFFESELGKSALKEENRVYQEWPFSFAVPASEIEEGVDEDEMIIVQGIVDMVVETGEGLLVVDFKTDNIKEGEACERAEIYRRQLELYGEAAEVILEAKLLGKWVYFLGPGCTVEIRS